jgi:hypothetical protein
LEYHNKLYISTFDPSTFSIDYTVVFVFPNGSTG